MSPAAEPTKAAAFALAMTWLWRAFRSIVVYSLLLLMLAVGWLVFSESAPRWLWQQAQPELSETLPALSIESISGSLASGLRVHQLRWRTPSTVLRIDELALGINFAALMTGRVALDELRAKTVAVQALTVSEPSVFVPPTITIPVPWALSSVQIDHLQWTAFDAEPIALHGLSLDAQGEGTHIDLHALALRYRAGDIIATVKAAGTLALSQQWPLQVVLTIDTSVWPAQRITLDGDLSALRARVRGPANYPLALDATVNALLPTLPFRGRLSWPQWQPPAQSDWRVEPGAMTFAGSTEQGELALDVRASLLPKAALPWPADEPRRAQLSGPLRWQQSGSGLNASVAWRGALGKAPWTLEARYQQAQPVQTVVTMHLADARLSAKGWPTTGLNASLSVPRLQRFHPDFGGAVAARAQWQGAWPDGQGQAIVQLKRLTQRSSGHTPWLKQATLSVAGRVDAHRGVLNADAEQGRLALVAAGGLQLSTPAWSGQLTQATVLASQGRWQLIEPAALSFSPHNSQLARACWQQTAAKVSAWQLCTQADLSPQQWLASLSAAAPSGGTLTASVRRDPTVHEPALDADLQWRAINLAALPMVLPDGLSLSGHSDGDIRISGRVAQPIVHGHWSVAASVQWPRYGLQWPSVAMDGRLTGQRSHWTASLTDSSAGQLNISGQAAWQPAISLTMAVDGSNMAFAYAPWVQGKVSPKVTIAWRDEQLTVGGEVVVNQADITLKSLAAGAPKPSADVVVVRARDGRIIALSEAPNGLPLHLHLRIILGEAIALTGYGLDAGLRGQLLLTQSRQSPLAANGEISLKPNAQFAAYGQRLTIEQGRLLFAGPLTTPDIRLTASRAIDGITVGVNVIGQAPKPTVTLTSDSPMSQDEILSYLVLGRALGNNQAASAADKQALALSAALNLTGKTGAVGLLGQRLGISDFAIGTQGRSDATEVAVSGRLSPKLWLSIGRGVFQPSQSVTVRYQINRRLSLEALSAFESAITLFYSWRF